MNNIEVVRELNGDLADKYNETEYCFIYTTNGYEETIDFNDEVLWCSEDDNRFFDEEINDYEEMLPFIKKQFKLYKDRLNKINFDDNVMESEFGEDKLRD